MAGIEIKRIYEGVAPEDGERVLVDRLWPRGVSRDRAHLDAWNKDVAPSPELRKWFGHDPERLHAFAARYRDELAASGAAAAFAEHCREVAAAGGRVTLLYAARDPQVNHALVLKAWLEERLAS
ncbi:MAG: DUF488 family protein [Collinsella sp.]|nr:DUF488 family protein [Collinsella sp.]